MRTRFLIVAMVLAGWLTVPALSLSTLSLAQETAPPSGQALNEAKDLYKEVNGLRKQMDKNMEEIGKLQTEMQSASEERRQEIQSEGMLKQRTMERIMNLIQDKQKTLYERLTALIDRDPESTELRAMRYKAAFALQEYGAVLDDIARLPDAEKDQDFLMIWGRALENAYRFEEALERYKMALKLLDKDSQTYVRFQMAACSFNACRFGEAFKIFSDLELEAPMDKRRQLMTMAKNAAEYIRYWEKEQEIRKAEAAKDTNPWVLLETEKGSIKIELFEDYAPNTVANFIALSESGFYDGLNFHRVIPMFMIQGGCPDGTGSGSPGYSFADECRQANTRKHFIGSLSMANSGPDTNGSQFFVTTVVTWHLNGKHTVFGRVLEGQDVVNRIETGERIISAKVIRKQDHEYKVKKLKEG